MMREILLSMYDSTGTFMQACSLEIEYQIKGIRFEWTRKVPFARDAPPEIGGMAEWFLPFDHEDNLGERFLRVMWKDGWKPSSLVILVDEMRHTREVEYEKIIRKVIRRVRQAEAGSK